MGNLGEFLGALAVFATLLYLAIQVRDAGRSTQLTAVHANRRERMESIRSSRDSPYVPLILAKLDSDQPLSVEEQLRINMHNLSQWALLYSEWVQRDLGMAGEYMTSDIVTMDFAFRSSSMMQVWREWGTLIYPVRFVEYVDRMAAEREQRFAPID